jgi:very-short-patch-repair endonuclease
MAPDQLARHREALRRRNEKPEWKAMIAEKNRRLAKDPEWLARNAESNRKMTRDPAVRAKMSATALERNQDPTHEGDMLALARRRARNPDWRRNLVAMLRKRQTDPVFQANYRVGREKMKANPTWKPMMTARNRAMAKDPTWQEKNRAHRDSIETPTKAELHIAEALEPLGFEFVGNQSAHRIAGLRPDFPHKTRNLVIEYDGYWVHTTSKNRAHDDARDAARLAIGYRTLRLVLPEVDEKTPPDEIRALVRNWMEEGGGS